MAKTDFLVPFSLTLRIKGIDEDELENYVSDFMAGLAMMLMSDDPDDDHFEVANCNPDWVKVKETYHEG